ncbi:hypothetical protein JYY64_003772 [Salmonella enterica subsp. houtenae serovar 50:g,z51:-]|nr:hypothetical protein [Salmonella enterica subsp. houtenae serovar 50:g,z51:-]
MKITTEDKALLDNLRNLAETNNNDSIAVTFELPRIVTVRTTYSELHRTFAAMIDAYQEELPKFCFDDTRENKTVGELIKKIKDKPVCSLALYAGEVAVTFSYDDLLRVYREMFSTHKNITTLQKEGGLMESIRQKD